MATELDPNEEDAGMLWAEIHRLRAAVQGPDGYDTWQQAATAERVRRVKAEAALSQPPEGEGRAEMVWCGCGDGYPENSYEAGFMAAAGKCVNCDAADATSAGHGEGWVSVFDELPVGDDSVLVRSCTGAFRVEARRFVRELHACLEPGESPAFTHWMTIPAAPTPKDNRHE